MIVYDFSDAYKAIATTLGTLDGLSDGAPGLIEESVLGITELLTDDLPYCVIETVGEMTVQRGEQSLLTFGFTIPIKVWYVRAIPSGVVTADILRADGNVIAQAFNNSRLPFEGMNSVRRVDTTGIDWSVNNDVNVLAVTNGYAIMGVSVQMTLTAFQTN